MTTTLFQHRRTHALLSPGDVVYLGIGHMPTLADKSIVVRATATQVWLATAYGGTEGSKFSRGYCWTAKDIRESATAAIEKARATIDTCSALLADLAE